MPEAPIDSDFRVQEKEICHCLHLFGGSFPSGSYSKESVCIVEYLGSILGLRRSPGEGNGIPFQYCCLENSMQKSLVGYSPRGHKVSDTAERLILSHFHIQLHHPLS